MNPKQTSQTVATTQPQQQPQNDKEVSFIPFGASDKIRLTAAMIRQFIAVPTKSGALPSERDAIRFIMLCRGKRANPFEGDCFLIGYDSQNGPSFSMVCGIELFMKRAEQSHEYDGQESGVVVADSENRMTERAGALVLKGEKIVGGWAKVYRKDKSHPEYKTVSFDTYNTGRSRWEKDPGGMIAKVALSQALRGAYPTALGGLYTQEEMQRLTETGQGLLTEREPIQQPRAISETAAQPDQGEGSDLAPEKPATPSGKGAKESAKEPEPTPPGEESFSDETIRILAVENGIDFNDCRDFLKTHSLAEDAESIGSYQDVPESVWKKLRANAKLTNSLLKTFGKKAA